MQATGIASMNSHANWRPTDTVELDAKLHQEANRKNLNILHLAVIQEAPNND
jgi:hypothetical protein